MPRTRSTGTTDSTTEGTTDDETTETTMTTLTLSPSRPAIHRPAPQPAVAGSLRLTGRGRLLVLVALLVLGFAALSLGRIATQASQPGTGSTAPVTQVWVVAPGETLWSIANRVEPNADPRVTVQRIVQLNGLGDAGVFAGERLIVPAQG